ncbi:MAG: hypothetical protein H3Z53_12600 [archaeon]|nr:hypothetical protein [archaeon]
MSTNNIPKELIDFLSQGNNILLIKGFPGTGKTTLSLELLNHFQEYRNGIYVSTRVTSERLFAQFPWLEGVIKPEHVLKAPKGIVVSDAKTKEYPTSFEHVYDLAMSTENPMIAIDSWEGIVRDLGPGGAENALRLFETLVSSKNANIILVSETSDQTTLDYFVDGTISLSSEEIEGRRIRYFTLNKTRGVEIKQHRYVFTLNGGRFRCFKPFLRMYPAILIRSEPVKDPDKDHISSGIQDFDNILDVGYRKGSFNLFELGYGVGLNVLKSILYPVLINYLNLGRGVIMVPNEGFSLDEVKPILEALTRKGALDEQLLLLIRGNRVNPTYEENLDGDVVKAFQRIGASQEDMRKKHGSPVLVLLGLDTLEHKYGFEAMCNVMGGLVAQCIRDKNVIVAFANENLKSLEMIQYMATTHWKLALRDRTLLINGIIPQTGFYVMCPDLSKGYIKIDLVPIL